MAPGDGTVFPVDVKGPLRLEKVGGRILHHLDPVWITGRVVRRQIRYILRFAGHYKCQKKG